MLAAHPARGARRDLVRLGRAAMEARLAIKSAGPRGKSSHRHRRRETRASSSSRRQDGNEVHRARRSMWLMAYMSVYYASEH